MLRCYYIWTIITYICENLLFIIIMHLGQSIHRHSNPFTIRHFDFAGLKPISKIYKIILKELLYLMLCRFTI